MTQIELQGLLLRSCRMTSATTSRTFLPSSVTSAKGKKKKPEVTHSFKRVRSGLEYHRKAGENIARDSYHQASVTEIYKMYFILHLLFAAHFNASSMALEHI